MCIRDRDSPLDSSTATSVNIAIAKAAAELGTFAIIEGGDYSSDLAAYRSHIIPRMEMREIDGFRPLLKASRIVEIDVDSDDATTCLGTIKEKNPTILVSIRLSYDDNTAERALAYAKAGTDIIHLSIDDSVIQQDPDIARDAIYSVHSTLVDANIRDCTTLVFSGGAAEAAHISKSLILGADAVSLGMAYQIALGCKVCYGKRHASDCRIWVNDEDADLAAQRIVNLVGSWRDQLLEVLGGMGLREARRQRGEVGRAIFYESLEMSIFGGRP